MSGADEFWSYYEAKLDGEAGAIAKAKRLRKLVIEEASLCRAGANPGAVVTFWKSYEGLIMHEGEMVDDLEKHLRELEPGLDWKTKRQESYGAAIQKHIGDPVVAGLYEMARYDEPESSGVEKREQWEPSVWTRIQKLAKRLRVEEPQLGEAASIAEVCRRRPDLYEQYRLATME